jgi:hypothetical protein
MGWFCRQTTFSFWWQKTKDDEGRIILDWFRSYWFRWQKTKDDEGRNWS